MSLENCLINGDCLTAIPKHLQVGSVDLIYLDPPFFSNKNYEILWGNGAELRAYEDRWKGEVAFYVEWMRPRIEQCHRVLKDTGSFYLHCDYRAVHHLRIVCDNIFGEKQYLNEIVWCYSRPSSPKQRFWGRMHDSILFYSKGKKWIFNVDDVRLPYAISSREREGHKKMFHKPGDLKSGKCELHRKGKFPEDWWQIPIIRPNAKERLGYPTQKPEALLERIIKASSNEGDLVLDPFVGGGTTIAVAKRLNRRWIGIDVSPIACTVAYKRLYKDTLDIFKIVDYPVNAEDIEELSPLAFQQWVVVQLNAIVSPQLSADGGIDGKFIDGTPIEVKKRQVGRPDLQKFESAIRDSGKKVGVVVGMSFPRTAHEYIAKMKKRNITIVPLDLEQVINSQFKSVKDAGIEMGMQTERTATMKDYMRQGM